MHRVFFAIIALSFAQPFTTYAQETAAEQEVWAALQECQAAWARADFDAAIACTHDDFIGWRLGEPVPRTKESDMPFNRYYIENVETKAYSMTPLSVKVYGNIAILHYYYMGIESLNGGEDRNVMYRWTDIMIKEDGKWSWIADHGGEISSN